jgi:hypothetical protein
MQVAAPSRDIGVQVGDAIDYRHCELRAVRGLQEQLSKYPLLRELKNGAGAY